MKQVTEVTGGIMSKVIGFPRSPCCPVTVWSLTLKHRETHGCIVSTAATDALVLKHQVISILNADKTFIVLDQFHIKNITLMLDNIRK